MIAYKQFDQALHDKYDHLGKEEMINFVLSIVPEAKIIENDERGGKPKNGYHDIRVYKNDKELKFGVEVKNEKFWSDTLNKNGFPFKYNSINVPLRCYKENSDFHGIVSSNRKYLCLLKTPYVKANYDLVTGDKQKIVFHSTHDTVYQKQDSFMSVSLFDKSRFLQIGRFYQKIDGIWKEMT